VPLLTEGVRPRRAAGAARRTIGSVTSGTVSAAELIVWRTMLRAEAQISRRLQADLLARHDLALGAYDVLMHLGEAPDGRLRMNDLADRVLLSRSGLTRLVDRMQRDGLVIRQSCASDARGLYAALTADGRARLAEATPTYRSGVRDHVLSRLDEPDLRALGHILDKLADEEIPA
jgi:DNA-binding MarR family transcriptional regulator